MGGFGMNNDSAQLPLSLVSRYSKEYPGIWDICQTMHDMPAELADWDKSRCYLPIGAALSIRLHYKLPVEAVYMLPALSSWRQWKEVYTFDPALEEMLYAQASDTKLPTAAIMQIPFPCIFISAVRYKFFAHLEYEQSGKWELRFARIMADGSSRSYCLPLGDMTISESIAAVIDDAKRVQRDVLPINQVLQEDMCSQIIKGCPEYSESTNADALSEMLQLYLYVCASNADIQQEPQNRKTYRPRSGGKVTDRYREVRKWDTGYYIGAKIRSASRASVPTSNPGTGSRKRTHIRRGHWHHFWKGSGDDRHLELQWVFPLVVNGDDGELPARINEHQ